MVVLAVHVLCTSALTLSVNVLTLDDGVVLVLGKP